MTDVNNPLPVTPQENQNRFTITSLYPLEVRAIPNGDNWLIIFSGITRIQDIEPSIYNVLVEHAINQAKENQRASIVGATGRGFPIYDLTPEQRQTIRDIVVDEIQKALRNA